MTETTFDNTRESPLDRTIDLTKVSWVALGMVIVLAVAVGFRFGQLDGVPLSPAEAKRAFQAYAFSRGSTAGPAQELPDTQPTPLLLQSLGLFLFGATDVTARAMVALIGVGLVWLAWMMAPFVGRPGALGMAALAAISPTLVYSSRTSDPQLLLAFFALLFVAAALRLGLPRLTDGARQGWAIVAGFALAAAFGSSSAALTVAISLAIGFGTGLAAETDRDGAVNRALKALIGTKNVLVLFAGSFAVSVIILFSRFFSDLTALGGIGGALADWGRLISTASSSTPTQFFLLTMLLYEFFAVVFAIVAANRGGRGDSGSLHWSFFLSWFVASLLIFSFSTGRMPEHAVHVALPLVLLGGIGLGDVVAALDWSSSGRVRNLRLFLVGAGFVIALIALVVQIERIGAALDEREATFETAVIAVVVVLPLAAVVIAGTIMERRAGRGRQAWLVHLAVVAVFLGAFYVRSSTTLSFYRADEGSELLAQRTSTPAVTALVSRISKLSRDATVTDGSTRDPTGGRGLSIAIDRRVQWPYRWYFRDYPDATVVGDGRAGESGAQVVIAPDDAGLAEAGYTPRDYPTLNRVPAAYVAPDIGHILGTVVVPSRWGDGVRYLFLRELAAEAPPETVAVGLSAELANRVYPNTGPFNLFEQAGAGNGRGQFNGPRGIAVAPDDGTIYVVDMGNARVERFDPLGEFIGSWGGEDGGVVFERTEDGLGPTGIAVSPDGQLIYVADTWRHRIVVLDKTGRLVREFGDFGNTEDSTDPTIETGLFFGPRDVAATAEEIYVVDTGNERVQVFGLDGTFRRTWGGYGSDPGKMIEPVGIAIGPEGRIYVADSGNARIAIFAVDGTPLDEWPVDAWVGQSYYEPYLAFDNNGYLYATSSLTGSIEVFDLDGIQVETLTQVGVDQLQQPLGITHAPDGSLLVTDKARHTVVRYAPPPLPPVTEDDDVIDDFGASPAPPPPAVGEAAVASPVSSPGASADGAPRASPAGSPEAGP